MLIPANKFRVLLAIQRIKVDVNVFLKYPTTRSIGGFAENIRFFFSRNIRIYEVDIVPEQKACWQHLKRERSPEST